MKTYEGPDEKGEQVYFEVQNYFLSRIRACKLVAAVAGTRIPYRQRPFTFFADGVFCQFEMGNRLRGTCCVPRTLRRSVHHEKL